ncbi:right-handed parallel beta-helix repeat-containing protein [Plantibacter flavus]|uniref:right-handed parallel beta-helix repeat-containing protein n=1 Tax=Plantibacter flavus TaxID=150123 RepID=UPI002378F406|nr:right-handed parallel beta-helix repeat-containing protein [Plantibacter flavus]MDD9152019.1 right-handed parallel beta-helix repeat-containing protein [Plantibacter flavus]
MTSDLHAAGPPTTDRPTLRSTLRRVRPTDRSSGIRRAGTVLASGLAAGALLLTSLTAAAPANAAGETWSVGEPVASDTFARTVATGFGSADLGGDYSSAVTTGMAVANGGSITFTTPGTARQALLAGVQIADVQATATITVPTLPTAGSGVYFGLQARSDGKRYYQSTLRVTPTGSVYLGTARIDGSTTNQTKLSKEALVASGLQPGQSLQMDLRTRSSTTVTVASRAWVVGAAKPSWQRIATDASAERLQSGGIGVWGYLSSAAAPLGLGISALSAAPVTSSSANPEPEPTTPVPAPTEPTDPVETPVPEPTTPATPTTPTTPATPTTPTGPDTQVPSSGRGSAAVGTTSYAIPRGALYVTAGNGTGGSGSLASPYTSLTHAVAKAPSGSTLVLRAGTYRESVVLASSKQLTVQSYPKEAVWLDGSDRVTGWNKSSTGWAVTGWNTGFDTSPTFTKGASDGSAEAIKFINPDYPLAAYPDQVWIDGVAQRQVASERAVTAGSFFVDRGGKRLILGTDPAGKTVTASKLQTALAVKSVGSVVRGLGVRNYGNSVYQMGAITAQNDAITFENLVVQDNATIGMYAWGTGVTFANITATGNGMMGGGANSADKFTLKNSVISGNNVQNFNRMPVSGGFKITRSRTVAFTDNDFQKNTTVGLWLDESVYNGKVSGNRSIGNGATGIILEISDTFSVTNNVIASNGRYGLWIGNTGNVQVWNNTITGNSMAALQLTQDKRRQTNVNSAGHDRRQPLPDMTVPWIIKNVTVSNNVISGAGGGCLVCVEDQSKEFTAEQMKLTLNGNVYQRASANAPSLAVRWGQGAATAKSFATVAAFTKATGQERRSVLVEGTAVTTAGYQLTPAALVQSALVVVAVPSSIAGLLGLPAGIAPARAGSLLSP